MNFEDLLTMTDPITLHAALAELLPERRLEPTPNDRISTMDTLGSLVDKLCTVNLKMWHNQEGLYAARRMTSEEFRSAYDGNTEPVHALIRRCCDLNVQRAALVDEIDQMLSDVTTGKRAAPTKPQHKTY